MDLISALVFRTSAELLSLRLLNVINGAFVGAGAGDLETLHRAVKVQRPRLCSIKATEGALTESLTFIVSWREGSDLEGEKDNGWI